MSDPSDDHPHRPLWWRIIGFLPSLLVTIWLVFDDVLDIAFTPLFGWFSSLSFVRRIERWARGLDRYAALALLILPAIVIEPAKLVAIYLIGEDHLISGGLLLIAAFALGIVFVERVFQLNRDKILSIGWFRAAYEALTAMRQKLYDWLGHFSVLRHLFTRWSRRRSAKMARGSV